MTPVLTTRIVASALVVVAASSAALILGFVHLQDQHSPTPNAEGATTITPRAPPAILRDPRPVGTETPPAMTETSPSAAGTPPAAIETPPVRTASQAPIALAAAASDPASIEAGLAGPPDAAGNDQSSPSFDIVRVEADGAAVIAGRAPPGATVDLMRDGERLDRAVASAAGEFAMVPPRLPAGSYELSLSAKLTDGAVTSSKHGAAVTVNDTTASAPAAQSRAEYAPKPIPQPQPLSEPLPRTDKSRESAGPTPAHTVSSKVIASGDSLWRISRIAYGDGSRYELVYRANRGRIRDPNLIYPGQTLVLPAKRD
jgi:nucleoid-associated protein YgaU